MKSSIAFSLTVLLAHAGCTGDIGSPTGADGPGDAADEAALSDVQTARIYRLTLPQYDQTLRDLLRTDVDASAGFIADVGGAGFPNNADLLGVNTQQTSEFHQGALIAAAAAMKSIELLFPCPVDALGDDDCARTFVEDFGRRAFRRPLTSAEVDRFVALHAQGRDDVDAATGVQIVIETMLQSPSFLFRSEIGDEAPGEVGELEPYEVATALSYYLWNTMPDDVLLDLAETGALSDPGTVTQQVDRLIADDRARVPLLAFYAQLFEFEGEPIPGRDAAVYPGFDRQLASMRGELDAFVEHVVRERGGDMRELFRAPYTFVDAVTAPLYGLPSPDGEGFTRVELDPAERAGILTQLGFLTIHATPKDSSPPRRGEFIVKRLLCMEVAAAPDNIPSVAPADPEAPRTTRERYSQHATNPACAGCHRLLDPAGFALEHYDTLGRFRTEEGGIPVDAKTSVDALVGMSGEVDGGVELSHRLSESDEVRDCFVRQSFRHAFGRGDVATDEAYLAEIGARFADDGLRLQTLHAAIASSPRYRQRRFPK